MPTLEASDLLTSGTAKTAPSEPNVSGLEGAFEMVAIELLDLQVSPVELPTLESLAEENRALRQQLVEIERRLSALEALRCCRD